MIKRINKSKKNKVDEALVGVNQSNNNPEILQSQKIGINNPLNGTVQILKSQVNERIIRHRGDQMSESDQQNMTMESPMQYDREETPSKKTPTVDIKILSKPNVDIIASEERLMVNSIWWILDGSY